MGTPAFAATALRALDGAGHEIACVYTRPPRPSGRGQRPRRSPVHDLAAERGFEVRTPETLRDGDAAAAFAALDADVAVVAAYGLILPPPVLDAPRRGCLNIHASLLPRWRGAAPIQRAILAGDAETGVTIMRMDAGLDTGPILMAERVAIAPDATAPGLHDALADLGARLIVTALADERLAPRPQPAEGATYAPRLARGEGRIDWTEPALLIERKVRALDPWPGAWCEHAGARLRVLAARVAPGAGRPGTVAAAPLAVACGDGLLVLERVRRAGRPEMAADAYVRGHPAPVGAALA